MIAGRMPPLGAIARRLNRRGRQMAGRLASASRRRSGWILTIGLSILYVGVLLPVAVARRRRVGHVRGWVRSTASTRDPGGFFGQY